MALNFRKFLEGLRIVPKASDALDHETGDLEVSSGTGKLKYFNNLHPVALEKNSAVVTEDHSAVLKNKTIDADQNIITNIENADIKSGANIARNKLASSVTVSSVVVNNASGVMSDLSLTSAQIILGNASAVPTATTVSGEVTISDTGVTTVGTMAAAVTSGFLKTQMESLAVASTISPSKTFVRLNPGSDSIDGVTAGDDGRHLILTNTTGSSIILKNQSGSAVAGARIVTGTGGDVSLDSGASLFLIYNSSDSRWYVVGGTGGAPVVNFSASNADIAAGDAVYYDGTTIQQLDAGDDSKVEFIGVALDAGGGAIRVQVGGKVATSSSGFIEGSPVFADPLSPGKYTSTVPSSAGQWVIPVGIAVSDTEIIINGAGSATAVKLTSESDPFVYAAVSRVTSSTTLVAGNSVVLVDASAGAVTITLPSPINGKIFTIKKVDSSANSVIIDPAGATTIDGLSSKTISTQYDSYSIVGDTTSTPTYYII